MGALLKVAFVGLLAAGGVALWHGKTEATPAERFRDLAAATEPRVRAFLAAKGSEADDFRADVADETDPRWRDHFSHRGRIAFTYLRTANPLDAGSRGRFVVVYRYSPASRSWVQLGDAVTDAARVPAKERLVTDEELLAVVTRE